MQIDRGQAVAGGVVFALLLVFVMGVWLPENRAAASYRTRIASAQEALGPGFFEPAVLGDRRREVERLRQRIGLSAHQVPRRPELASVLGSLTRVVEGQGIDGQRLQTRAVESHPDYSEIPLELEFVASFPASYGVLEGIETMTRLVRVDALSLRFVPELDNGGGTGSPRVRASYRLSGFFLGDDEETGP